MPFIVQCPYPECKKFMLLEDSTRGTSVDCPICKKSIRVDASSGGGGAPSAASGGPGGAPIRQSGGISPSGAPIRQSGGINPSGAPGSSAPAQSAPVRPAQRFKVANCPKCTTPLQIPATADVPAVKCGKCGHIFKV